MEQQAGSREASALQKFFASKKILIVDSSSSARSGLFSIFQELGVKTSQIILSNSFNQADALIGSEKPDIVVVEYDLNNRCGLELLQKHRQSRPQETKSSIFIIVTNNTSQSAVARAAEEDVDAFVIKPFTPNTVARILIKTAVAKMAPPAYLVKIEEGKLALAESNLDKAEAIFNDARALDPAPALACYYIGQVNYCRKVLDGAQTSYKQGLEYNKIHYKCMVGLYDLLMSQQKYGDAYDVVKKISQYFPANPKRLAEVLRLAIINGKYEDIERYYAIFINVDERDEQLIKYICAALIVCGKYYLGTKVNSMRALQLFQKAAATGTGRANVLCEIILSLLEYDLWKEARVYLKRFPPDCFNGEGFLLMRFLIDNSENVNVSLLVDQGRALLKRGVSNKLLYVAMIRREGEAKNAKAAEDICLKAATKYPEAKAFFEDILKTATNRQ